MTAFKLVNNFIFNLDNNENSVSYLMYESIPQFTVRHAVAESIAVYQWPIGNKIGDNDYIWI